MLSHRQKRRAVLSSRPEPGGTSAYLRGFLMAACAAAPKCSSSPSADNNNNEICSTVRHLCIKSCGQIQLLFQQICGTSALKIVADCRLRHLHYSEGWLTVAGEVAQKLRQRGSKSACRWLTAADFCTREEHRADTVP